MKKATLAAVGIGTVDQVMLGVLKTKHYPMRLWGLSQKVLIIDEIHAYDPYILAVLKRVLELQAAFGNSVILLSATLPISRRAMLIKAWQEGAGFPSSHPDTNIPYPALTHVYAGDTAGQIRRFQPRDQRRFAIELMHSDPTDAVIEWAASGGNVCWIRNTVDDAVETYQTLRTRWGKVGLTLFHARFILGDRLAIQASLLQDFGKYGTPARRRGRIVIATPVVEQSLDIDFDWLISDLAPIDLLIQRLGRMRRHRRRNDGTRDDLLDRDGRDPKAFAVFSPPFLDNPPADWFSGPFPRSAKIYVDHAILWRTCAVLCMRPIIELPEDVRAMMAAVYESDRLPAGLEPQEIRAAGKAAAERSTATGWLTSLETGYDHEDLPMDEDVVTRLGLETRTLRLAKWNGKQLIPFFSSDEFPWHNSEVRVFAYQAAKRVAFPDQLEIDYQCLCKTLPDKNPNVVLVVMRTVENGTWSGQIADKDDHPLKCLYSSEFGLRFEIKEQPTEEKP